MLCEQYNLRCCPILPGRLDQSAYFAHFVDNFQPLSEDKNFGISLFAVTFTEESMSKSSLTKIWIFKNDTERTRFFADNKTFLLTFGDNGHNFSSRSVWNREIMTYWKLSDNWSSIREVWHLSVQNITTVVWADRNFFSIWYFLTAPIFNTICKFTKKVWLPAHLSCFIP